MENTVEFACSRATLWQMKRMRRGILLACPEFDPRLADLCATYALSHKDVAIGAAEVDNVALFRRMHSSMCGEEEIAFIASAANRAARLGSHNVMRYLIEELGLLDRTHITATWLFRPAVKYQHRAVIACILPHIKNDWIIQAVSIAALYRDAGLIQLLIREGADPRMCGAAVKKAAANDDIHTLRVLLDAGAPACQVALITAAQKNSENALEYLLERADRRVLRGTMLYLTTRADFDLSKRLTDALAEQL